MGWKGLINDPDIDESFKINKGLRISRKLFCDLTNMGVPIASEMLDTISPQVHDSLADAVLTTVLCGSIVSWSYWCTNYRISTPSRISLWIVIPNWVQKRHRRIIGHCTRCNPCRCLWPLLPGRHKTRIGCHYTYQGQRRLFRHPQRVFSRLLFTGVNSSGKTGTNYDAKSIETCRVAMAKAKILHKGVMVDCSHGNSQKNHKNQPIVARDVAAQLAKGERLIRGVMIESNINEGISMQVPV